MASQRNASESRFMSRHRPLRRAAGRGARRPVEGAARSGPPPATLPPRAVVPPVPQVARPPAPGRWLWTCRAGFEAYLFEELFWAKARPELVAQALVSSERLTGPAPVFARQGFRVVRSLGGREGASLAPAAAEALLSASSGKRLHLQAWTPDTEAGNRLASLAESLGEAVTQLVPEERRLGSAELAREQAALLGQLCVVEPALCIVGLAPAREALSLAPGGRQRTRRGEAPSRAGMKLEEALDTLGLAPGRGEVCVDLGAAPGGWTQQLVSRGAAVIAVDPANLAPELERHPRVRHVKASAFSFEPEEPADWLFCDMAWRPLEVAQLLAKWGRRGWALHLVANIKLPMKDKNPIVHRVRHTLVELGGWKHLRARQLYHDRDEVTVTARRV